MVLSVTDVGTEWGVEPFERFQLDVKLLLENVRKQLAEMVWFVGFVPTNMLDESGISFSAADI